MENNVENTEHILEKLFEHYKVGNANEKVYRIKVSAGNNIRRK